MARQILASRLEHAPSETTPLALRRQIKLKDLAAVAERRHAIASIAHIADDQIAEFEHQKGRPARDGETPPGRTSARDHALELPARNNPPIGLAPRRVMYGRNFALVAESRSANGNDRLDHGGMLSRRAGPPQGLDTGHG